MVDLKDYLLKWGAKKSVARIVEETGYTRYDVIRVYDEIVADLANTGKPIGYGITYRAWTPEESDQLKLYLSYGWSHSTIAKILNRNEGSISARVRYLVNHGEYKPARSWYMWTPAELNRLQELRKKNALIVEIAHELGRSEEAIKSKIAQLRRKEDGYI